MSAAGPLVALDYRTGFLALYLPLALIVLAALPSRAAGRMLRGRPLACIAVAVNVGVATLLTWYVFGAQAGRVPGTTGSMPGSTVSTSR